MNPFPPPTYDIPIRNYQMGNSQTRDANVGVWISLHPAFLFLPFRPMYRNILVKAYPYNTWSAVKKPSQKIPDRVSRKETARNVGGFYGGPYREVWVFYGGPKI